MDIIRKNIVRKIVIENPTREVHNMKLPLNFNFEKIMLMLAVLLLAKKIKYM